MTSELLSKILANYEIKQVVNKEEPSSGSRTRNLIFITKDSKYFLKQHHKRTPEKLIEINKVMKLFYENNLPVVMPIKTKGNEDFVVLENLTYSIYPFIKGDYVTRPNVNKKQAIAIAKLMAESHKISTHTNIEHFNNIKWKHKPVEEVEYKFNEIIKIVENRKNKDSFDLKTLKILDYKLELINKFKHKINDFRLETNTIIHGDFHSGNCIFNNDKIVGLIDFDNAKVYSREAELVWCIFISFFDYKNENFGEARSFLKNYQEVFPTTLDKFESALKEYFFGLFYSYWAEKDYYIFNNAKVKKIIPVIYDRIKTIEENLDRYLDILTKDIL